MKYLKRYSLLCLLVCGLALGGALVLSRAGSAVTAMVAEPSLPAVVVIDPGHGGEDGGTVSALGTHESRINLEIALKLDSLLHFLGTPTRMIRTEDVSVETEGETIAQRKVSDIKHRVQMVESVPNALLVSIHENHFTESKYRGAQVFYARGSEALAEKLQAAIATHVDPNNHRQCKAAQNIYLMEHVTCPAVLVECGFLSNPQEELLLRQPEYQKKLAAAIACTLLEYLEEANEI